MWCTFLLQPSNIHITWMFTALTQCEAKLCFCTGREKKTDLHTSLWRGHKLESFFFHWPTKCEKGHSSLLMSENTRSIQNMSSFNRNNTCPVPIEACLWNSTCGKSANSFLLTSCLDVSLNANEKEHIFISETLELTVQRKVGSNKVQNLPLLLPAFYNLTKAQHRRFI